MAIIPIRHQRIHLAAVAAVLAAIRLAAVAVVVVAVDDRHQEISVLPVNDVPDLRMVSPVVEHRVGRRR